MVNCGVILKNPANIQKNTTSSGSQSITKYVYQKMIKKVENKIFPTVCIQNKISQLAELWSTKKCFFSNMLGIIPSKISQLGHWGLGNLHMGGIRGSSNWGIYKVIVGYNFKGYHRKPSTRLS